MKEIEIFKKKLNQVLKDGLLDNTECHGKMELDDVHLDNLVEELLDLIRRYFLEG